MSNPFLISNLTWNPFGWTQLYLNPAARHRYAQKHPGHESFNFNFNKQGIDKGDTIYGFSQWTNNPVNYENGGSIIFCSRNLNTLIVDFVGIYCKANILDDHLRHHWEGLEDNTLAVNIRASKKLSMLLPVYLNASKYIHGRAVGQVGFHYSSLELHRAILLDAYSAAEDKAIGDSELSKLKRIVKHVTGDFSQVVSVDITRADEVEQSELIRVLSDDNKDDIRRDLRSVTPQDSEVVVVSSKTYKRDNKTIAQLKILRDFKCQLCDTSILKRNGDKYIEAAHIKPKRNRGIEAPSNILILCPNHHKEFDYGDVNIIEQSNDKIRFIMNGQIRDIDLRI